MSSIEQDATEAARWFETATRTDDSRYVRIKDDAPEWVTDLAHEAHGDMFPDDWRYQCISAVLDHLAEGGDPDDAHEFADSHVDVYTSNRLAWLSSNLTRAGYCDEAADEFGAEGLDIIERIGLGQYMEASEVFSAVVSWFEDNPLEDMDTDDAQVPA